MPTADSDQFVVMLDEKEVVYAEPGFCLFSPKYHGDAIMLQGEGQHEVLS